MGLGPLLLGVALSGLLLGGCQDAAVPTASPRRPAGQPVDLSLAPPDAGGGVAPPSRAKVRWSATVPAPESTPPVRRFVTWLGEHPEVVAVSLVDDTPIARLRYSDGAETVVGAVYNDRAVCIRHGSPVQTAWGLRYLRRASGHSLRGVVVGPQAENRRLGTAYEFRFPEGTVHLRRPQPLQYAGEQPYIAYGGEVGAAPANAPALPTVDCPAWASERGLSVGYLGGVKGEAAVVDVDDGTGTDTLCQPGAVGWRCWPPLPRPQLVAAEPDVPPQDQRLPSDGGARLHHAWVSCETDDSCILLVEWSWARQRIAHTYRWEGSFLTLHRAHSGGLKEVGRLRSRIRIQDNGGRFFRGHLWPAQLVGSCFQLVSVSLPKNLEPDSSMKPPPAGSPYALPPPGTYCITDSGVCYRGPELGKGSTLPLCPVHSAVP